MNQANPFDTPPNRTPQRALQQRYSSFLPFLIVLLTLILTTSKDTLILYKRNVRVVAENARADEPLKKAAEQAQFVDGLRLDLIKLSATDPVAARIVLDFFPTHAPLKKDSAVEQPQTAK